jgi:hypothetical protein
MFINTKGLIEYIGDLKGIIPLAKEMDPHRLVSHLGNVKRRSLTRTTTQ